MQPLFEIIHEDEGLLVVNKPAGLVCHPTKGDVYSSLISRVRLHLGADSEPQLINRLDRETSGLVVVAKNPATARQWRLLWESGAVRKNYLAIVHGHAALRGQVDAPLGKDLTSAVAIKDAVRLDGSPARTDFQLLTHFSRPEGDFSLLEVQPFSGRKHQIRIHLAHLGHPIVGDKIYGKSENYYLDFVRGELSADHKAALLTLHHCLHAQSIDCQGDGFEARFTAPPEPWFEGFVPKAGGGGL